MGFLGLFGKKKKAVKNVPVKTKKTKKATKKKTKKSTRKVARKTVSKKTVKRRVSKKLSSAQKKQELKKKQALKKKLAKQKRLAEIKKKKAEFKKKRILEKKKLLAKKKAELHKQAMLQKKLAKAMKTKKKGIKLNADEKINKLRLGIPGLDKLFKEGIPEGAAILVEGGPGSGKTIFELNVAYNACKKGMKVLYMTFEEPERRLRHHMKGFGWDSEKYEKKGLLKIKKFNSLDVARSVEALLSEAKKELLIDIQPVLIPKDFQPDIVCIDSLSSIASAFTGEDARFRIYMEQLFKYLESNNITSFLVRETSNPTHTGQVYTERGEAISFLSDGIIVMYNVIYANGKRGRALEVLKMRGEEIDRRIVEAEIIDKRGFIIYPHKQLRMKGMEGSYKLT